MATCRSLIRRAMLEIRAIGSGEEPSADELADGLDLLNSLVSGIYGTVAGEPLIDAEIEEDTELDANTRCLVFAEAPITLTFPESPLDGQRIQIQGVYSAFATYPVTIEATPTDIVLNVSDVYTFLYLANTASWTLISPLTADSENPLGDDEYLTLAIAKRLAPMFGASLTPESQMALRDAENRVQGRFFNMRELQSEIRSSRDCIGSAD